MLNVVGVLMYGILTVILWPMYFSYAQYMNEETEKQVS